MKKVVCLLFALFLLFPCVALAGEVAAEVVAEVIESELPTEPVSWEQLATIAGCALATMLVVQLLKLPLDKVWKIPTRIVVFFISFVIMILANLFTNNLSWSTGFLTIFNATISALTAMGGYELTFAKLENKKE